MPTFFSITLHGKFSTPLILCWDNPPPMLQYHCHCPILFNVTPSAHSFSDYPQLWHPSSSFTGWIRERSTFSATPQLSSRHPGRGIWKSPRTLVQNSSSSHQVVTPLTFPGHHCGTISRAEKHENTGQTAWGEGALGTFPFHSNKDLLWASGEWAPGLAFISVFYVYFMFTTPYSFLPNTVPLYCP